MRISQQTNKLKAFSIIELSVVILIIGILISGILASNAIIKKFRIQTAQTLTISSPINGIPDSVLWLESSLDKSFKSSESSDTSSLSAWYDIRESVNKNNAAQSNSSNYPTYSNSINNIQAVKFDGTNGYLSVDGSVLNNTNYTIFVLEQRDSNKSGNYFIGDSSSGNESTTNKNLVLGYIADGTIKHSQSSDNSYTANISSYSASSGKPRVFTFVHDRSVGKKTYINGLLAATSTDTNHLSGMTTLTIGKSYQGQLGEVVIFARALTAEERQSVEDYLGKKWNSTILRTVGSSASSGGIGGSCVGGTVSTTGCQLTCTVTAATGITATTVSDGSSVLTCDTSNGFTGSLPYTCSNGKFSYTGATACSCQSGYALSGSVCSPINPSCSGGTESTVNISGANYKLHTFNSSGTLTCTIPGTAQILVVGGGGAGGNTGVNIGGGGGGGAGGVVYGSSYNIYSASYTVTVGNGATSCNSSGSNSVFSNTTYGTITAYGGGGGGGAGTASSGGSGGGSSGYAASWGSPWSIPGSSTQTAQSGTSSYYGNPGITGFNVGSCYTKGGGGGGGGAGGKGDSPISCATDRGGNGGPGISNDITGTPTYYAAGGGGGSNKNNPNPSSGGTGGGGAGANGPLDGAVYTNTNPGDGSTSGSGGGGGFQSCGKGAKGIVIVRYGQ